MGRTAKKRPSQDGSVDSSQPRASSTVQAHSVSTEAGHVATDAGRPRRDRFALRRGGPPHGPVPHNTCARWAVCGFLLLVVALAFGQTVRHEFVNYDDGPYVYENPQVSGGLTLDGVGWAFTHGHSANWHPLTWLSHMLDCQLYGLHPWGHHLTNVLLHGATAIVLFLVLLRMTGALWPAALVATVFAIHPLRVESVAWVAERKDVLSGLFFMLTIGAYLHYAARPFSIIRYLNVVLLFALGLMAKPMLVTLPFVLLLLDYWPLRRFGHKRPCGEVSAGQGRRRFSQPVRLLIEKIPLLVLSAASCVVTIVVQREALESIELLPLQLRISNALVSYVSYTGKMFCPAGLAVFYPRAAESLSQWQVAGALLMLVAISAAVIVWGRKYPYLPVGWLWYLGMLVPVAGLVQVGTQSMADRYTYLPHVGLYIMVAWALADISRWCPHRACICGAAAALAVLALLGGSWQQTSCWHDSESLWTHTLACTASNAYAHSNLGVALGQHGYLERAIPHLREAIRIDSQYVKAYVNLGVALGQQGKLEEAIAPLEKAIDLDSQNAMACYNLGIILEQLGQPEQAVTHYAKAVEINPHYVEARIRLGVGLLRQGHAEQAVEHLQAALQADPRCADIWNDLGGAYYRLGNLDEAIRCFQQAIQITPGQADFHKNLGIVLLQHGDVDDARAQGRESLRLQACREGVSAGCSSP
jgi:protein O-mannosyl-transferase